MTTPTDHSRWGVDPRRIDRNWRAITFELDAPRPGRIERMLRALGLPTHLTRLVVATPALRRAWFVACALAMLVAMGPYDVERPQESLFVLLVLAPLVPVLGVSFAYGVEADPAHEVSLATPMRGVRLILTRAATVLTISIALLGLAALLAPEVSPLAFAWLLPALGLTTASVALMTVFPPRRAALVTTGAWMTAVIVAWAAATDRLAAFSAAGQVAMVVLTVVALVTIWQRRDRFDQLAVAW